MLTFSSILESFYSAPAFLPRFKKKLTDSNLLTLKKSPELLTFIFICPNSSHICQHINFPSYDRCSSRTFASCRVETLCPWNSNSPVSEIHGPQRWRVVTIIPGNDSPPTLNHRCWEKNCLMIQTSDTAYWLPGGSLGRLKLPGLWGLVHFRSLSFVFYLPTVLSGFTHLLLPWAVRQERPLKSPVHRWGDWGQGLALQHH